MRISCLFCYAWGMKKRNKNKEYKPKEMTVDELASITLNALNTLSQEMRQGFQGVKTELRGEFDARFDKLEATVVTNHENRISSLEDDIRIVKTKTGIAK